MTTTTTRVAFRMSDADRRNLNAIVDLMRRSGMPLANQTDAVRFALDRIAAEARTAPQDGR
jgi:hypothetical protein